MAENALNNTTILKRVIYYCNPDFTELRNMRLVNRLWHEETLGKWRRRAVLKLIPDETRWEAIAASMPAERIKTGIQLSTFLHIIRTPLDPYNLRGKPFQKLKLHGMKLEDEMRSSPGGSPVKPLPLIWDKIERFIEYLHLEECSFENSVKRGVFYQLVFTRTPILERLVMTNNTVLMLFIDKHPPAIRQEIKHTLSSLEILGNFPMPLCSLLVHFPNITEIKLDGGINESSYLQDLYCTTWSAISCMRQLQIHSYNLKRLDVMEADIFKISLDLTKEFRRTLFPLELLSVQISPGFDAAEKLIGPMLSEHKGTLKTFKVFCVPVCLPLDNFPIGSEMLSIRELWMWGNVIGNLNFLSKVPNLEVLYINTTCYDKWEHINSYLKLHPSFHYQPLMGDIVKHYHNLSTFPTRMTHLRDLYIELHLEPLSIEKLAECLPNLKAFRSVLNNETFGCVCGTMSGLEELGLLFGSSVDNEALTGFSADTPRNLNNVTRLAQLKRFQLDGYCHSSTITDISVHLGFLMMPTLQRIQICVSEQMSRVAEKKLQDYVAGQVKFIRNYGEPPHLGYDCCRRRLFAERVIGNISHF